MRVMNVILRGFLLVAIGTMAMFTWLFVDWVFPPEQFILKLLVLLFFDIAAAFWGAMDMWGQPATEETHTIIKSGIVVGVLLSISTTLAYILLGYATRFTPIIPLPQLALIMDFVLAFAVAFNFIMLGLYVQKENEIRHPRSYLYSSPKNEVYVASQTAVIEELKPVNNPPQIEAVSTNKPESASVNKSEVSTNKKKLP